MQTEDIFKRITQQLKQDTPNGWEELKLQCRTYDGAMEIVTDYKMDSTSDWKDYDCGDFELMDLCEELADATYPTMDEPWTKLLLFLKSDNSFEYEYDYGDPKIFES